MKINRGLVVSRRDSTKEGLLLVVPYGRNRFDRTNELSVVYTTPYRGNIYAGMWFVPEELTEVLYCQAENSTDIYYYLCSLPFSEVEAYEGESAFRSGFGPEMELSSRVPVNEDEYKNEGLPQTYGFRTPLGNGLLLKDTVNSEEDDKGVVLRSARNNVLNLNDSAEAHGITLQTNGAASKISLTPTDSENTTIGPEGVETKANGNIITNSTNGSIKIRVDDGENIQIHNNSTGSQLGPTKELFRDRLANVQISTKRGDIDIKSGGHGVFIDCYGTGDVQIRSKNKIKLFSTQGIDMKTLGDINMKGRNVNIQSDTLLGGTIQLNSTTPIDPFIRISKTNPEMVYETLFSVFPFFLDPQFSVNYMTNAEQLAQENSI